MSERLQTAINKEYEIKCKKARFPERPVGCVYQCVMCPVALELVINQEYRL